MSNYKNLIFVAYRITSLILVIVNLTIGKLNLEEAEQKSSGRSDDSFDPT